MTMTKVSIFLVLFSLFHIIFSEDFVKKELNETFVNDYNETTAIYDYNYDYEIDLSETTVANDYNKADLNKNISLRTITDFAPASQDCSGKMTLIHTKSSKSEDVKTVRLSGKEYPNLPRGILRNQRKLIHAQNVGDCCWEFYSKKRFRGEVQKVNLGFDSLPQFPPKSLKKIEC